MEKKMEEKMEENKEKDIVVKALEDMQISLEPIRDKAMDQRARWVGFVECAELMLKAMANKAAAIRLGTQGPLEESSIKEERKEIEEKEEGAEEEKEIAITLRENLEASREIDNSKWSNSMQKGEG